MRKLFLTSIAMTILPLLIFAQSRIVIEGEVIVREGDSPAFCRVTLIQENGEAFDQKIGDDGHFIFEGPDPGFHEIVFEMDGYETIRERIEMNDNPEDCCVRLEANLETGDIHREGFDGGELPFPPSEHDVRMRERDDFIKMFEDRFHEYDHLFEGIELEPRWARMIGEPHGDHFVGFIPVRHLIPEPGATLGLITIRDIERVPDGTFALRLNDERDFVEFFNTDNDLVSRLPIMLSPEDMDRLRKWSEKGGPIGGHTGAGGMMDPENVKERGEEDDIVVPPGHEGNLCIGYWDNGKCIGIYLSW